MAPSCKSGAICKKIFIFLLKYAFVAESFHLLHKDITFDAYLEIFIFYQCTTLRTSQTIFLAILSKIGERIFPNYEVRTNIFIYFRNIVYPTSSPGCEISKMLAGPSGMLSTIPASRHTREQARQK